MNPGLRVLAQSRLATSDGSAPAAVFSGAIVESGLVPETRHVRHSLVFAALVLACHTASSAYAQTPDTLHLTLDSARALAIRGNLDLAVAAAGVGIAAGRLKQARTYPFNPVLDVAPVSGDVEVGLSQEIEIAGQRRERGRAARFDVDRAEYTRNDAVRVLIADVDRAFYQVFAVSRRLEFAREVLALNERLRDFAMRQLKEGKISKLDFNLVNIELGRSKSRSIAVARERNATELELRRLLSFSSPLAIMPVVDSTQLRVRRDSTSAISAPQLTVGGRSLDDLVQVALRLRPDLEARDAIVRRSGADVAVSRREAFPNLVARVARQESTTGGGSTIRPSLGIALPFLNRNRGEIQSRQAAARGAELERSSLALRIRTEVEAAVRAYVAAAAEIDILESTVLAPARENRLLLEAAYREGKVGLPVLLLIRNQVIDAELEYWSAWLAEREALVAVAAATGELSSSLGGGRK